ncbi:flagellar motor protein MotB [bacterium LRH843]|nr:flagellar motor protein MotB [bacterium LRH843]
MWNQSRRKKVDKGAPKWMVTFSDLMTLILVFFILLFSMSAVDAQKFRIITESFQNRQIFEFMPSAIELDHPGSGLDSATKDIDEVPSKESETVSMEELLSEVQVYLEQNDMTEFISANRDDRGIVLVLQERTLFETAEAELLPEAKPFLKKVGTLLAAIPNMVKVEGHTDSRPISTYRYPSNWELSGARASSVIRYLIDSYELDPKRFSSTGFGDTRPLAPNTTIENLQKNRRVVIVISDPMYEDDTTY